MENYRGFDVYYSNVNNAYNATPDAETKEANPGYFPIAARTMEELTPVLDMMIDRY